MVVILKVGGYAGNLLEKRGISPFLIFLLCDGEIEGRDAARGNYRLKRLCVNMR